MSYLKAETSFISTHILVRSVVFYFLYVNVREMHLHE